jgi:hypothetical protein
MMHGFGRFGEGRNLHDLLCVGIPAIRVPTSKSERSFPVKRIFLVALFVLASTTCAVATPSVAGKWTIHRSIAGNEGESICTFNLTGDNVTGDCQAEGNKADLTGTVDGNKVTWKYDVDYNGSTLTLTYTGTLDDTGTLSGTINVQPFNVDGEFTAKPFKEDAKPADAK